MNNFKLNFALVAHSTRTYKNKDSGEETTTVSCLFVRTIDKDLDEKMNEDNTYPYCDALTVRLAPAMFEQVKAFKDTPFICDSYAEGKYKERISARKIKIGGSYVSLRADDIEDTVSSVEAVPSAETKKA